MKKGLNNWFEIFKAGTHTDGFGATKTWTVDDLNKIVQNTNLQEFSVPLVVGHPRDNFPAYGLVAELKVEGEKLFAKAKEVSTKFEEFVKTASKGRSIALSDNKLRHIGFLAVENPAIKDLAPIEFSEYSNNEAFETYEFSAPIWSLNSKFESTGRIFQKLRDLLIEKYGLETADIVVPQWWIDDIRVALQDESGGAVNAFAEKLTEDLLLKINQNQDQSEFAEKMQTENQKLQEQIAAMKNEKRQGEFTAFCENLVQKGQLTPAQKELALQCFGEASKPVAYEFSEEGKHPVIDAVKALLEALPKQVEFAEKAKKEGVAEFSEQDADLALAEKIVNAK